MKSPSVIKSEPDLRFPGFIEDWSRQEFGKLAKRRKGKFNPIKDTGDYQSIELESIVPENGTLIQTFDAKDLKSTKTKFEKGDVLFGKLRPYLKKYYYADFEGVCTSEIWALKCEGITSKFLYFLIQTPRFNKATSIHSGSKMPRAEWSIVEAVIFGIPEKSEQEKIADYLSIVDEKTAILEQKVKLMQKYKHGVMLQIFNQQIRFKDKFGKTYPDWEEKPLGNYIVDSKAKSKEQDEYLVMTSSRQGLIPQTEYYGASNRITNRNNEGYNVLPSNFMTYRSRSDDGLFRFNLNTSGRTGIVSYFYPVFEITKGDAKFFEAYLNANWKQFYKVSVGTSQKVLAHTELKKIKLLLPVHEEQIKIADFFSAIDKKIEFERTKLYQTKMFKKALLQRMFV